MALNYQTSGLMMDLNDGKYIQNGGCGYVLKPAIMREPIAYFSANTRDVIPGVSPQILHVKVSIHDVIPRVFPEILHVKVRSVMSYLVCSRDTTCQGEVCDVIPGMSQRYYMSR